LLDKASAPRDLDAACDAGGLFRLDAQPHIIATRSRLSILGQLLRHAATRGA
jgi:hypothetical protein